MINTSGGYAALTGGRKMKGKGKPKMMKGKGKPMPVMHGQQDMPNVGLSVYGKKKKAKAKMRGY